MKKDIDMTEPFKLNVYGIKCDHCPYDDMTVQPEEYDEWLNKPCPDCGENLLTEEDYTALLKMMEFTRKANAFFNRLPKFVQKLLVRKDGKAQHVPIELNGSGKTIVDLDKSYEKEL